MISLVGRRKDPENKETDINKEVGWTAIQMYSMDKHLSQVKQIYNIYRKGLKLNNFYKAKIVML